MHGASNGTDVMRCPAVGVDGGRMCRCRSCRR